MKFQTLAKTRKKWLKMWQKDRKIKRVISKRSELKSNKLFENSCYESKHRILSKNMKPTKVPLSFEEKCVSWAMKYMKMISQ